MFFYFFSTMKRGNFTCGCQQAGSARAILYKVFLNAFVLVASREVATVYNDG